MCFTRRIDVIFEITIPTFSNFFRLIILKRHCSSVVKIKTFKYLGTKIGKSEWRSCDISDASLLSIKITVLMTYLHTTINYCNITFDIYIDNTI